MEGHTWIYVIALLAYLYFATRVYDLFNTLQIKKAKIKEPTSEREEARKKWLLETAEIKSEINSLRRKSLFSFMAIPFIEGLLHFLIGNYELNGQLLSAGFFVLFLAVLLIILFALKGRTSDKLEKKYTWKTRVRV